MMRNLAGQEIAGSLALLALLAGCGERNVERTVKTADGSTVKVEQAADGDHAKITATSADGTTTFSAGADGKWPEKMADYAPAYPGAKVTTSMAGTSDDGTGGMVTFETSDSPQKVVDFYKPRAAAAGLGNVSNMDMNGTKIFGAGDEATGRTLSIQASVADGKTTAMLSYGTRKK